MDEGLLFLLSLIVLFLLSAIVLPIVALVRTGRIRALERRLATLETEVKLLRAQGVSQPSPEAQPDAVAKPQTDTLPTEPSPAAEEPASFAVHVSETSLASGSAVSPSARPSPVSEQPQYPPSTATSSRETSSKIRPQSTNLEQLIGQRWMGWIAVTLILLAAGFFLKYAFDNQWIGPAGRVAIGLAAGLGLVWLGWQRFAAGWKYFSQVLSGGGISLVFLSVYASFGFYQLIDQTTAFLFLVLVVILAHWLAVLYQARAMVIMAQAGGFLVPILLSSGRDQYLILFSYIVILNLGVVLISFVKNWSLVGSISLSLTYLLFLVWYSDMYRIEKRPAALVFLLVVFGLYLLADLAPHFRSRGTSAEAQIRLALHPFIFFAFTYDMLEGDYGVWMGLLALSIATVYAAVARALQKSTPDSGVLAVLLGVALVFVTLAIPIQLEFNWVTIGWAVLAAATAWWSVGTNSWKLRFASIIVFCLAIAHHFEFDSIPPGVEYWPVLNRYYLAGFSVVACLLLASRFYRKAPVLLSRCLLLGAVGLFWIDLTIENYKYWDLRISRLGGEVDYAMVQQLRWTSHMLASVLWALLAALLTGAGFRLSRAGLRWAGLCLFGITVLKVVLVDMSQLQQIYRIIAFLVVGVLLLGVAWWYQRTRQSENTP